MPSNFQIRLYNKFYRPALWNLLSNKTQKLPLETSQLILSFDCDTEEDIRVGWDVHSRLVDMGITPVYAVPGELLKKGASVYGKIHATGSEFINHGGREHTYFDVEKNRHASNFFYDQQSQDDLREDILLGHKTLKEVLGVTAKGWRTPHFGTFQHPDHLQFLYGVLKELEYTFSSSTSPQAAYLNGPLYRAAHNIVEIPVTGIYTEPMNIMDTWAYFAAPDRTKSPEDYVTACDFLAERAAKKPLLINIYGDPSHVHDQEAFFQGMKKLVNVANNTNYSQLLGMTHENVRRI